MNGITQVKAALLNTKIRNWKPLLADHLTTLGYLLEERPWGWLAWQENLIRKLNNDTCWVEGVEIRQSWLGNGSANHISVSNKRLYFPANQFNQTIKNREYEILKGLNRPVCNTKQLIQGVYRTVKDIVLHDEFNLTENTIQPEAYPIFNKTLALGAFNNEYNLQQDMWTSIASNGAFQTPTTMDIVVVHDIDKTEKTQAVLNYCNMIENKYAQVNRNQGTLNILKVSLDKTIKAAKDRINSSGYVKLDNRVYLIAITGKKGTPLPEKQLTLLNYLDQVGYQYRLFSYDNDNLTYSASNQLMSLIEGAGGISYRLKLPLPEAFDDGAFFGLDVGHDATSKISNLVVSVVDCFGRHVISVKHQQPLNESIQTSTLNKILLKSKDAAEAILGFNIEKAIIFRDGKIPEKRKSSSFECISDYLEVFNCPTSIIELRKRQNPPIFVCDHKEQANVVIGQKYQASGTHVQFFNAYASNFGIPNTFKVAIPPKGDTLDWGIEAYSDILCGLCYSSSLGMKPHLPGPIYWADGIAKTSETDNRFRGQHVIPLD